MGRFGSSTGYGSDNLSSTTDPQGNPIVSPDNSFAASPLGYAARAQALFGIANPTFNLTPADSLGTISAANQLPYWSLYNDGDIIPTMYFDSTTETWDVDLNPSGAGSGATLTLKTRSYLLNDSNLSLRQKAYLSLTKNGSFSGTAQWNVTLGAEYFTYTGSSLGSYALGTVTHSGTWTSISGTTTSGGTAIDASAYYVDLSVTMTTLGTVTDTTTARLNSILLQTSQLSTGGATSFVVSQTFTSSGTWTRPTGVDYVNVMYMNGGGGGQGGQAQCGIAGVAGTGGNGGTAGSWNYARDVALGTALSISVGIGAGGAGGFGGTVTKASGGTIAPIAAAGTEGAAGGLTTFGSYLTNLYGVDTVAGGVGGVGGAGLGTFPGSAGGAHGLNAYSGAPFAPAYVSTGAAGAAGTSSRTAIIGAGGSANTSSGLGGGGGGGGNGASSSGSSQGGGAGGKGGASASGGGGGGVGVDRSLSGTIIAAGGNGGTAPTANYGGAGGGGGGVAYAHATQSSYNSNTISLVGGRGGDGQTGLLVVVWIG